MVSIKGQYCAAVLLLSSSFFLGACSKKEEKKEAPKSEIPLTLAFVKPTPGVKLTRDQALQIKQAFARKASMILPPGELIFIPKGMSANEKKLKENQLQKTDANSFELLNLIRSGCAKTRPTSHIEATFPIDNDSEKNSIRTGDYMSATASGALGSANCPVDVNAAYGMSFRADDRNFDADTGKLSGSVTSDIKAVMNNPRFATLLGARGIIVQSTISGLAVVREVSKETPTSRALIDMSVNGSYLSLTQDIPVSLTIKSVSNENKSSETIITAQIQMKDFSFKLDSYTKSELGNQGTSEMYLNGHPFTQEDSNALFGDNNPNKLGVHSAAFLQ